MKQRTAQWVSERAGAAIGPQRGGFTLTEMLVAIGLVTILTLGIGRIFRSVQGVVSGGTALVQADQLGRALERQLRDDFRALNLTNSEDSCFVIRMRELGDVNRNNVLDADETALYLTQDDRNADRRDGIAPYEERSRAVTRRLDEMCFVARSSAAGGVHRSYQLNHPKNLDERDRVVGWPTADHARIYYGHALRPAEDPLWPPEDLDDPNAPNIPVRQYTPDGIGSDEPWGMAFGASNSLNEFSSEWILARQSSLLYGSSVLRSSDLEQVPPTGTGREFSPYIREAEGAGRWLALRGLWGTGEITDEMDITLLHQDKYAEERMTSWGRVDIVAQDITDVRRWLEGERPGNDSGLFESTPYLGVDESEFPSGQDDELNAILWDRVGPNDNAEGQSISGPDADQRRRELNEARLRGAVSGMLFRPLAVSVPPRIDRAPVDEDTQPSDAAMDVHAVIASRCSRFEISWSDGTVALDDIDLDNDGVFEARRGDVIWFDISPLLSTDEPPRSTMRQWIEATRFGEVEFGNPQWVDHIRFDLNEPFPEQFPEINFSGDDDVEDLINVNVFTRFSSTNDYGALEGGYSPSITGGAPVDTQNELEESGEYLAVWPFRAPSGKGEYTEEWRKDFLVRVRATLHDEQNRLPNGKTFEFIFRVSPR